jgi:RNA polymerase sigma factor (sigma-70 family)
MPRKPRLQPLARAVLRTQTDDRLVTLARDGKEAAFDEIVRRYRSALVAFAAAYGPPDPEDVVQESLVRSWDALRDSTGEMHLKAWLYTIVRNRALNARRDMHIHEPLSNEIDGVPQPPEIVLTNDELRRAVVAVGALPEAQREALVRSALEGHTHDQIAAAMGSSPGAVRQLIYRGRMTVRHGVGAVIPLPLVAALAELGAGSATVTAGTAAGTAAAAGAAGGGSLAAKAAMVAAVGALAAGSGVAIKRAHEPSADAAEPKVSQVHQPAAAAPTAANTASQPHSGTTVDQASGNSSDAAARGGDGQSSSGNSGSSDPGSQSSGPGGATDSESSGPSSSSGSDDSGHGSDGSGSGSSSDSSGSGSSGSEHPEGDSSGHSGAGDSPEDPPETDPPNPPEPVEPEPIESSDHSGPGGGHPIGIELPDD